MANDIVRLFEHLNEELKKEKISGELYLVGGAVMCLVYKTRPATRDVDAHFEPAKKIRGAARKTATKLGVDPDWLNDGVKGFLSGRGQYDPYLDLSHLKIYAARADYLLAMKCLAMRIGEEFFDLEDIRYLLRYLNITSNKKALEVVTQYYPLSQIPQKTLYALEELVTAA